MISFPNDLGHSCVRGKMCTSQFNRRWVRHEGEEGSNETDAVEGEVVVRRLEIVGTEVVAYEIDEVSANGESSGAMDHAGGHLRYVLDTDPQQYPAGTTIPRRSSSCASS